jgi:hypothetical protein
LYFKRQVFDEFLQRKLVDATLVGADPATFWARAKVLDIELRGGSQRAMRDLLRPLLLQATGRSLDACGCGDRFIYFDDVLFSGDRIENDLVAWLRKAPQVAHVDIVVFAAHAYGCYQLEQKLKNFGQSIGKKISFALTAERMIENRLAYRNTSEVLWPASLPKGAERLAVGATGFVGRSPGHTSKLFPSEPQRH